MRLQLATIHDASAREGFNPSLIRFISPSPIHPCLTVVDPLRLTVTDPLQLAIVRDASARWSFATLQSFANRL